jgi:hypothetical protein
MYQVGDMVVIVRNSTGGYHVGKECVILSTPSNKTTHHPDYTEGELYRLQSRENFDRGKDPDYHGMWHIEADFKPIMPQLQLFPKEAT